MTYARFSPKASSVLEKKIFKGFYHIWAWWPSWSMDRDHFSNFSFPQPKEAPYEIWAKLAQGLQRRSRLKMLTDGRTHGWTDDWRKVITIAHPEHSSGELKMTSGINSCTLCTYHVWKMILGFQSCNFQISVATKIHTNGKMSTCVENPFFLLG